MVSMTKTQLTIRQNVTKPCFCPNFAILRGHQGCPKKNVWRLCQIISSNKIRHIPIIEEKKLLGIVSIGDVVNHIIEQYKDENQQLRDFINQ